MAIGEVNSEIPPPTPRSAVRVLEHGQHAVYECGRWELDLAQRELRTCAVPVPLGSRALQIFAVLVESAGKLVAKNELMARVWLGYGHAAFCRDRRGRPIHGSQQPSTAEEMARHGREIDNARATLV